MGDWPYSAPWYRMRFLLNIAGFHYRVYTEYSEMPSKVAFDPDDPPFGRVIAKSIQPPLCVLHQEIYISAAEGSTYFSLSELFVDISDEAPLAGLRLGRVYSILKRDDPGSSPDESMALVQLAVYMTSNKRSGTVLPLE